MTIPKTLGFISGLTDILLLQTFTGDFDAVTRVVLYIFSGVLVTALTTLGVTALLKLVQLPTKEEWIKLSDDITTLSKKLDVHLAGYEEWKKRINGELDNE